MLRQPLIFMAGVYLGGNRYRIHFEALADYSATKAEGRDAALHESVARFAAVLEQHCRAAPYNWFNFFDFWQTPPATGTTRKGRR
jgi:predicted LPLAT superfamily acyltransferase